MQRRPWIAALAGLAVLAILAIPFFSFVLLPATLAGMVPEFSAIDMPYQFRTTAEADAVLDGAIGTQLFDKLAPKGLIGLAYMEQGFRHTTNSTRPITKWEDFDGLKIRVQPSALYIDMFNQLGANARLKAGDRVKLVTLR